MDRAPLVHATSPSTPASRAPAPTAPEMTDAELAGLGDEATTVDETKLSSVPRSVVIYVRAGATNDTITASSLDPFDDPATRARLQALLDEKL